MKMMCNGLWPGADAILDKNVEREIINHRRLVHPNVLAFREVFATEDELAIVVCAAGLMIACRVCMSMITTAAVLLLLVEQCALIGLRFGGCITQCICSTCSHVSVCTRNKLRSKCAVLEQRTCFFSA